MFEFNKVVIWGYKIYNSNNTNHTHSWVHQGFYRGFKKLGYETYWFTDNDYLNIDFEKTLFITMNNTENKNMPCRSDCYYILHNCEIEKFFDKGVSKDKIMILQVYTHDCKTRDLKRVYEDDPFQLYNIKDKILYFPWATDIFPEDIKNNMKDIKNFKTKRVINFVGTSVKPWDKFMLISKRFGILFNSLGGNSHKKVSINDNQKLIQESFMAPSIQSDWQVEKGYIPCRIFKNISYGKFGITNSNTVNEYFNNELIYDKNVIKLFQKAYNIINTNKTDYNILLKHMQYVSDKHTYINRCETLINIFDKIIKTK